MNPIAIRLLSQQLICPQFDTPKKVVSHFGAMQAQDYRMVRWAVMMRTRKPSSIAFKKAFDEGEIVRLHLLRGTWQLVSNEDYWWMLDLISPKATSVVKGWMKSNKISIDDSELNLIHEIFVQKTDEMQSVTSKDLNEALLEKGIIMDKHRLSYHIRFNELNGTFCSGNLLPTKATYSLTEKKVPRTAWLERDEMLMLLARKYFQSHSPATFEDYVWWSGLSTSDCQRSIELLGSELRVEKWKDYQFYLHESCRTRGFRRGKTHLIAPFDEYLIGYKSRELVIHPHQMPSAYTNNGIFFPVIAHDGRICGNWIPWEKNLNISYFDSAEKDLSFEKQWKIFNGTIKKK
ncbi:winged helix DNA-binding domain-containing protein [Segatella copri]|uniref:winged helix DNA-binding domain-containing protein n=1 Tax=Segatella copri TaxID=165179 RepID=UPI002FF1D6B4